MSKLITSVKNFTDLADAIRSGNACIPVTFLSGMEASVPHPFFGSLIAEDGKCLIVLRSLEESADRISARLCWSDPDKEDRLAELDCILDGHLEVKLRDVRFGSTDMSMNAGVSLNLEFNEIACSKGESSSCQANEVGMIFKIARSKLNYMNLTLATNTACSLEGEIASSWKRNALGGDSPPYRYKIQQDGEDLLLSVKLLEGETSPSSESERRFMSALILTFVWINGGHPYAYYRSLKRDGILVEGALQSIIRNPRSKNYLIRSGQDGIVATAIMESGIKFFSSDSEFAEDLRLFLWQYRDATAEGSITLGMLLQACSLLEGLIGLTLRYPMKLSKNDIDSLVVPGQIKPRKGTAEARFLHAGNYLGFDWATQMEPAFRTWKSVRNALAHGNLGEMQLEHSGYILDAYCQTIQAFNAIALRLIGYKGKVLMDKGWFAASGY